MPDINTYTGCDIFTPDNTTQLMQSYLTDSGNLLEPSLGTGNLLKGIDWNKYNDITLCELKPEYIEQFKVNYPNLNNDKTEIILGDFLLDNQDRINKTTYSNIILNPPYIRIQNLEQDYKKKLKTIPLLSKYITGNFDIYHCFILKCLSLLKDDPGSRMVSITPNSYLYTKSANIFREYLYRNKFIDRIIDYKTEKIFKGVSTYVCITVFSKNSNKSSYIYNDKEYIYFDGGTFLKNPSMNANLDHTTLNDVCKIYNGIATLRDKIFIHQEKLFEEQCWKEIVTPKGIKWAIVPYNNTQHIAEDEFKQNNPHTYKYLEQNKAELAKRDKGNKKYPTWYCYGRSQGLSVLNSSNNDNILYLSTFIDPLQIEKFIITDSPKLCLSMVYIIPNKNVSPEIIKNCIIDNIEELKTACPAKGGGWITLSTSVLKGLVVA